MAAPPKSLNVSLTAELTDFIASRVASGRYQSASEVVRAALRLLERDESGQLPGRPSEHSGNESRQAADA